MGLADDIINGNKGLAGDIISGNYTKKKKKKSLDKAKENAINSARESLQLVGGTSEVSQNRRQSEFENLLNQKAGEDFGIAPVGTKAKKGIATGVDIAGNILQGGLSAAEGVSDFARYRYADIADLVGANKSANKAREIAKRNDTEDIATSFKHIVQGDLNRSKTNEEINENDFINKNSIIKEDSTILGANVRNIFQGVGNTMGYAIMTRGLGGAAAGLENLGKAGKVAKGAVDLLPIYMSAAGGGQTEAYNEAEQMGIKITDKQARRYGTLSGIIEAGTESMFGGLGAAADTLGVSGALGLGKGALDDKLVNSLSKKFKSALMKNLVDLGIRGMGEGTEELVSGFFNAAAKKMTYMSEKDFKDLLKDQNLLESFISGTLSSVITQAPANLRTTIQGREASTGITNNENKVIEAEVEERTKGKDLAEKEISKVRDEVREDLQNGYISTDVIEKTLGEDYDRSNDSYLQESYNEKARKQTSFNTDLNQYKNEDQRKIVQKAIDSGILNDSKKTHNFVDLVSKIAADKGMDFEFTNNERIKESGFGVEGKTVNGYVNGNTIGLNIESNNALNKTVGHEITHVLEGSDMYQALQDSLKSYVGEETWNRRIKELSETYKNVENADVTKELTADLVGENLFNNEDFVRSLSTKNRNLFEKIFDEIKYLVRIATAGSKEKRELVRLQKVFQEAYRDSKTTKEGTQYSLEQRVSGDKLLDAQDLIEEVKDVGAEVDDNGYVTVYHQTSNENARKIRETGEMLSNEPYVYFSTSKEAQQSQGRGETKLEFKIPAENLILDDLFSDNADVKIALNGKKTLDISNYLISDNIKYSLTDNQGRQLSEQQQEYFKDSKIRNENGELETVYHTTPNQFTIFDSARAGENTGYDNTAFGSFVTTNRNFSERFGDINEEGTKGNTMEMYANITNPITHPYNAEYKYSGEELDNIVENWFNAIDETEALEELQSYVEDGEYDSLYQAYRNTVEFSDESPFEYASDEKEVLQEKGYDGVEFVEGLDKDVNYNVSDSNEPVSSYAVFDSNQLKNIDNSKPTSNPDIRYSLSVEEANTTQDNEGRKLTDNQLAYFKDSKAVDENGNLVTVYHTMTNTGNQFFEFNPVGTDFYRFGDQVVNYFTDNQDMSGSYADSNYKRAYTKPIKSMEDVQDFIKFQNTQNDSKIGVNGITSHYSIEKNGDGYTLKQTPSGKEFLGYDNLSEEGKVALNRLRANERVQKEFERSSNPTVVITDTLKGWDIVREYKGYPELAELVELYDRESQKLIATGSTYEEQMVIREILKNDLENYLFGTQEYSDEKVNEVIERSLTKQFENEQDLIDNIQKNFQAKYQYAGYINMTNPYVIDTFGENWDSVTTERNEAKSSEYNRVVKDNETKEKLYNLAQESERLFKEYSQSNKPREFAEYSIIKNKINNSELREVVNDMGMFGLTYEGWLEAGKKNAELFGEEYKQTLPNSDEKISNYTESLNPAELELVQDLTIGEFVNRYGELYKENMKFGDSSSYFKDQFKTTTGTTLDTDKIGYSNMFDLARYNFDGSSVSEFLDEKLTTNDLVKRIIEKNNSGETNYDGLIMKNVYDYGGQSNKSYRTTGDLYVTFNSNQFKAVDNLNPTDDADIRYQLGTNEVAPTNGWDVRGRDIALESAIAPLQEQVQQLQNTIQDLRDNIAPITEQEAAQLGSQFDENEIAPTRYNLTSQESKRLDFLDRLERENMLTEDLAEERNELMAKEENAPEGEDMTPIESLTDVRDMDEAAKDRSVNAYQYEHPEVKPYFQEEARVLLTEINEVIPGERFMVEGRDYLNPTEWKGYKRQASEDVANLLDGYTLGTKYTKDQLRDGLNAIIEDHGLENKAVSKRLEFMLDDRLRNGYKTIEGYQIEPNQDYLNMLKEQSWDKYYDEAPIEEAPNDIRYSAEDEFDLAPFEPQERSVLEMADNEGYRKSTTQNRPPIPYKQKSGLRQTVDAIKSGFINRNVEIDNLSRDSGNRNIKFYGDMMNGAMGEVSYDIGTAQTNNKGETIGKSIKGLFEKAKKQGLGAAFNDFLINYSNIDRYKQNKGSQTPLEVSKRLVRDYAIKYPEFKQWAKDVWNYGKNARQNLVDAGLIDQQLADYLGEIYPHYVPYVSDYENADIYFEGVGELIPRGLKKAKGNAGKLLSVEDALSKYTYAQKMAIRQNDLYKEIVHTLGQIPNFGVDERTDYTDMRNSLYTDSRGNYLTAYENGKQITTQVSKDLFKELSRTTENQLKDVENKLSLITKPLQGVSKLRKSLITTWNPTFPVTNAIKDLQDALFNSKHTKDMVKNYPGALKELATGKGKEVNQFLALYGSGLTMGEYSSDSLNQLTEKIPLVNTIKQINEIVELAPRYAEFKASLQNGETLQEAIYNAREVTTNFNRGGNIAKAMNRNGFTFLNASIQGFDKFIRNFSGENGARGIVQSLAKVAALGILPALFNHLAYDDDEEYEELKDYIKDNYYLIKTGEGKFIRIPKGRMLSIFGSAARRALESASGEEDAFEGYLGNAWNQIGINDPGENNIFAPFIQAFGSENGSAWYGGDIVPSRLQKEKTKDQYDENTDKFSIWLGDKLGVSPKKINYVLDQYLGGIGDVLLPMGTEAASSDAESVGEYAIAPWKDKFTASSVDDSKYPSEFYSTRDSIPSGVSATDEEKLQKKYLDYISYQMTDLYAKKREVQSNPELSKKEKYRQATEIKEQINELAKQGLEDYKNVDISGNYATINGIKYKKGSDGKWTKQRK